MRPDGLLYQNGDWGIYTGTSVGLDKYYSDVVHECGYRKNAKDSGLVSYQIIGITKCPGCGEIQPDDIQTLWALHNMDKPTPTRVWGVGPMNTPFLAVKSQNRIQKETIKK